MRLLVLILASTPAAAIAQEVETSTAGGGLFSDEEIPDAAPESTPMTPTNAADPLNASAEPPAWIPRVTGHVQLETQLSLDTSFDRANEQIFELAIAARFELSAEIAENLTAYARPGFTHVSALDRETDDRSLLYLDVPEAHVTWTDNNFHLRAGTIIFSWGSSDLIAPSDVLNPLDLRRTSFGSPDEAKIPLLAAEAVLALRPLTIRAVLAPVFTASRFHLAGWDSSISPVAAANGLVLPDLDGILGAPTVDRIGDQLLVIERPSDRPDNATVGLRATLGLDTIDLSATFVHGWEPLPRLSLDKDLIFIGGRFAESFFGSEPLPLGDPDILGALGRVQEALQEGRDLLQGSYQRRTVIGGDATWAIDPIVVKADVAYSTSRTVYNQRFEPVSRPWLNAVIGAEYIEGDKLQVIVEGFLITLFDVRGTQVLLLLEPKQDSSTDRDVMFGGLAGVVRYSILEGDLGLELGAVGTTRGDLILRPTVRYRADDHHRFELGGAAIEGRRDGYGGIYTNTDRVFIGWTWTP